MTGTSGQIRVGISGWSYPHWRGLFYPPGLRTADQLGYVVETFPTVEVNRTFYSLLFPDTFRSWYEVAPAGFQFAVKGSRFITHNKKLKDIEQPLANFAASGILELKEKMGPILWQLSPNLKFDAERIARFLGLLPTNGLELASLARQHNLEEREVTTTCKRNFHLRHALEPRHPSFFVPDLYELARKHGVAIAISHSSEWPTTEEVTADFVYLRLHGPTGLYASAYGRADLRRWAQRINTWAGGSDPCDVYVYFDNDAAGHAPRQALELSRLLGLLEGDK